MLSKMGSNLLRGKLTDLMKMGTPAFMHNYKSLHNIFVNDLAYMENFIKKAMEKPNDPVHKLKCLCIAQLAAIHICTEEGSKSPLNPILGETLFCESESGTKVYMEQTSHHPPIANLLIEGPPDCPFKITGHITFQV